LHIISHRAKADLDTIQTDLSRQFKSAWIIHFPNRPIASANFVASRLCRVQ